MQQEHSPIIDTVKNVMPSVVSITIAKSIKAIEKDIPPDMVPFLPLDKNHHLRVPKEMLNAHGMIKVGGGSGFLVSSDGIVVTNKHVVVDPRAEYTAVIDDGKHYTVEVLARDPIEDVAIVKLHSVSGSDALELPAVPLGDSHDIVLGQEVLAIGNALGLFKNTVSRGIISGLARAIQANADNDPRQPLQELRGLIQTDAAINPGNSGGPLVNLHGHAIGINAAIVYGAQNLSFAIPINAVKRDLKDLKIHGRIRRPLLGLRYVMIDEPLQRRLDLPVSEGALVFGSMPHAQAVIPESPAAKADVRERDIIVECDGQKITSDYTIQDALEEKEVGDTIHFTILRKKKTLKKKLVLTERK
ncbi:MAG: hypothetical protein COU08_00385 [Candidatus Harrisonbacteria bacterium CG10_big_fil_rev_8_21_14_0_10_42_17]|uniref:PDZ domain-containing protein n=1 Tax=Candidatus Harrisonbacteria bacterium CG10_big_fil_rev_8_21_14_0_10_42_17 TaxID=1974584 RepID=A0A2M6WJ62_9BACT|nr:MAG: hypothetical protein COU08_00385 [Candidatus Harrisonbacteria bacterium CG10_big_fil_rev_8_21_14_0_10_42_17]